MGPKPKEMVKIINRQSISDSTLLKVPLDAIDGFQDRIEQGVEWGILEQAIRHHKAKCLRRDIPIVFFSDALENKIKKSILGAFLDENSKLSLQEHWEITLPIASFDNDFSGNEESKICYHNTNSLTDNIIELIQNAVKVNSRDKLKNDLKKIRVLRLHYSEITHLDNCLSEYHNLTSLNLSGNFIATLNTSFLPQHLKMLELQCNGIRNLESLYNLPFNLLYLGLARNFLTNDSCLKVLSEFPQHLTVLDLSENDIYHLEPVIEPLKALNSLQSLLLVGNPCAMCMGYARYTITQLPNLRYLDNREILTTDRPRTNVLYEPHPDDLRSTSFVFTVLRVMSAPCPPKLDKGGNPMFHVELELPLLDAKRRMFLMYRHNESLTELMPPPEDDGSYNFDEKTLLGNSENELFDDDTGDIFSRFVVTNPRVIRNYTIFESNKVPWSSFMNFQDPTVKIFCPDLVAVRNTFRSVITVRLVCTQTLPSKPVKERSAGKLDKKDKAPAKAQPLEQRVVIAAIKCALQPCDWSQSAQHFHWDSSLGTNDAIHWGDGDLSILQYHQGGTKPQKGKSEVRGKADVEASLTKQEIPENLTCHFSFGLETLRVT